MATRKEIIVIEVKGTGKGVKQVENVTASFDELTDTIQEQKDITIEFERELVNLQQQLSKTSKANLPAQRALKGQIVGIKNALKDQRISLKELGNERTKARESVGKSIKSTDLNTESLARNYGAIQILDQFTGGLASQFRAAEDAGKLFNLQLKATRTALIATGIGAFIVALGLVVAFWDDISEAITGANKALQRQIDLNKENLETLDFELKLLDEKLKILELEGESTEELIKQKNVILLLQQEENAVLLEGLKLQLEREKSEIREVTIWEQIKIAATGALLGIEAQAKATAKAIVGGEEERTRLDGIRKQIQDATLRTETLKFAILELNKVEDVDPETGEPRGEITAIGRVEEGLIIAQGLEQVEIDSNFRKLQAQTEYQLARRRTDELITRQEEEQQIQRLATEQAIQEQKIALTAQTFGAIADIIGTNSKAGKAAAIAQATINTFIGISEVWASKSETGLVGAGFLQKILTSAAVLATGLKTVKSIKGQKLPALGGRGNANIASSSAPALPASVEAISPSFSLAGATGVNQLADSIGGQSQQPLRAFVVAADVTSGQRLDDNIISTATIG